MESLGRSQRYVIGNWKMNARLSDAVILAESIKGGIEDIGRVKVVLCPPFPWLYPVKEILKTSPKNLELGAQNMYWVEEGAYTGEVSPLMLRDLVKYVIIGHSERRYHFNENDDLINDKVLSALSHQLIPILCIGERKKNKDGQHPQEVIGQLKAGLKEVTKEQMKSLIIAYEPVWAIGTGDPATGEYAGAIARDIRECLKLLYGVDTADTVPVLYGGSVTGKNIGEFMDECEIDGALVGGASLKFDDFLTICKGASEYH